MKPLDTPLPALCAVANMDSVADVRSYVENLLKAGAELIQLRAKEHSGREFVEAAQFIMRTVKEARTQRGTPIRLIINDRADICSVVGADGVHVGQDDIPPSAVRALIGNEKIIGLSTHSIEQVEQAPFEVIDYIGFGPVFPSRTKLQNNPVVGLESLRAATRVSKVPVIAIGGITAGIANSVYETGARCIAVIKDLEAAPSLANRVNEFNDARRSVVDESIPSNAVENIRA